MLLIVTNKTDLTSDYLILRLQQRNIPFFRFNTEDYQSRYEVCLEVSNFSHDASIVCRQKGVKIKLSDISGVYFRRPLAPEPRNDISSNEAEFAGRESLELLRSLWRMIDESIWLNHPKHILIANNKVSQLIKAKELGLTIPDTMICANQDSISRFHAAHDKVIAKAVKHGFYKNHNGVKVALTREVTNENVIALKDYAEVPVTVQNKIDKIYDVRVNVVGEKVFATAILSQEHLATMIDWRLWDIISDVDLKHEKVDLPVGITRKCIDLTRTFNLNFSAMDFVLSKNGNYYFLEMNPNGQWAWIEEKTGYPIRDTIIEYFQSISCNEKGIEACQKIT